MNEAEMIGATPKAPPRLETERLVLRRPHADDAEEVFARWASDREVSRYLAWRLHESLEATRAYLAFCDTEWDKWPGGPYLVESRDDGRLVGSTGFSFETPYRASTGYVFARSEWGRGLATEATRAVATVARTMGLARLYALCHIDHTPSARVLEKAGFVREGVLRKYLEFPNLDAREPASVICFAQVLDAREGPAANPPSSEGRQ